MTGHSGRCSRATDAAVVEIPRRVQLTVPVQVMAPPPLQGDPCYANLLGFFPTKMAGLQSLFYYDKQQYIQTP